MKNYNKEMVYIGMDVHKKTYAVTAICGGVIVKRYTLMANPEQLVKYIKKCFSGAIVNTVYEAGFSGICIDIFWLKGLIILWYIRHLFKYQREIVLKQTREIL